MKFLVYSEDPEVGAQLTGRARALADQTGGEVIALTTGDPALCFKYGVTGIVFGGDEINSFPLSLSLQMNNTIGLRVGLL